MSMVSRMWGAGNARAGGVQLFAASAVNIIDSIVITEETDASVVLAEWIAFDNDIAVYSELSSAQAVRLFINWSERSGTVDLRQGDYFTFVIPDIFIYDYITNVTDAPIMNSDEEIVATYSIYDNSNNMKEIRITFTDYVENHTNISGDFWLLLFVGRVDETELRDIEFIVNGNVVAEGEVIINPDNALIPRNRKTGFSSPAMSAGGYYIFEWLVYINMSESLDYGFNVLEDFSFEDIIPINSPHVFLTDEIRSELGLASTSYQAQIGEYTGADSAPPQSRYQLFLYHYNSIGENIWYNFIDWHTFANGLTTSGINGNGGLNVSNIDVTSKLFSADLGTLTRPTAIRFYTISTVKMAESALGDSEVVGLFRNIFMGSYEENLSASLTLYRFAAGGSAQGITGDYSFSFTKVNENGAAISGAMFSLFTSQGFSEGADRFALSDDNGVVAFNNLPVGAYYVLETAVPIGYIPSGMVYRVVLSSTGFEIYYGPNFENRLSDLNNQIVNMSEFEPLPVLVTLAGTKNLAGRALENGMFSFVVKDMEGDIAATGTNDADGNIHFTSIEFNSPGTHTFTVEEVREAEAGIIYDGSIFTVAVITTVDGSGDLMAEVIYPYGGIVFNNNYSTTSVLVTLTGTKNLTCKTLESGMFSFVVIGADGNTATTGTNDVYGNILFSSLEFAVPGVYTFTVEEVREAGNGIIYDGSVFTVTVTVEEDGNGNLTAEVIYPYGGIVFNNSYAAPCQCCCRPCCKPCCVPCCKPRCIPCLDTCKTSTLPGMRRK